MSTQIIPLPISLKSQALTIYQLYPLHVARPVAIRAINKAIKAFGFEYVKERTELYAKIRGGNKDFMPHPSTFYNQERFADDPETWKPRTRKASAFDLKLVLEAKEKLAAELRHKHAYDGPFGLTWDNQQAREQYRRLKAETRNLNNKLAGEL